MRLEAYYKYILTTPSDEFTDADHWKSGNETCKQLLSTCVSSPAPIIMCSCMFCYNFLHGDFLLMSQPKQGKHSRLLYEQSIWHLWSLDYPIQNIATLTNSMPLKRNRLEKQEVKEEITDHEMRLEKQGGEGGNH